MCPHCRQNVPIVYRGFFAYCSACNAPRAPFSGKSLNLAGQPSQVGGTVATAFGWIALVVGLAIALAVGLLVSVLAGAGAGLGFGAAIGVVALAVGALLLFGGSKLKTSGVQAEREAKMEAIYGLAVNRGGAVTPLDVSRSLSMGMQAADELLTAMTKTYPEHVSVEVDDNGALFYQFLSRQQSGKPFGVKFRVVQDGRVEQIDQLAAAEQEQARWEAEQAAQEAARRRG